jgi:hypothetical protein
MTSTRPSTDSRGTEVLDLYDVFPPASSGPNAGAENLTSIIPAPATGFWGKLRRLADGRSWRDLIFR